MTVKNRIFLVVFGFFIAGGSFALPLENLLQEVHIRQLMKSGAIDKERFDTTTLEMVPRNDILEKLIAVHKNSVEPNLIIESLRLYKKPFSRGEWTASEKTELFNEIVAVSSLKGLEYYSKRRNTMRLLYETSTIIDNPDMKNPRPDPVFSSPPSELSIFVRQKDLTFGDNVYKYTYYSDESSLIVLQENISPMNYGIINVLAKSKLKSIVAVFDCGPNLLVYAVSFAKASMVPGMKQRAGESINNRANALLGWFTRKADRVFGKTR